MEMSNTTAWIICVFISFGIFLLWNLAIAGIYKLGFIDEYEYDDKTIGIVAAILLSQGSIITILIQMLLLAVITIAICAVSLFIAIAWIIEYIKELLEANKKRT